MQEEIISYPGKKVSYYFDAEFSLLAEYVNPKKAFIITDENIFKLHKERFQGWSTIVIKAGEQYKQLTIVEDIVQQLIEREADRESFIIGVGGGVVTDITGFVAGIYMRGIKCAFVPTSLLAMVDASVGGKNGVDVGLYKNLAGLIRQPEFIFFDDSFLNTLPGEHWSNGFAEIIKHAAIKDASMFEWLETKNIDFFQKDHTQLANLVRQNVLLKTSVVVQDEMERGDRKLLNFGHTIGHAIENKYQLLHGHAVSIGMVAAVWLSKEMCGLSPEQADRLIRLLKQYGLPVEHRMDKTSIAEMLKMDKKRNTDNIHFILLEAIGKAIVQTISFEKINLFVDRIL